MKRRTKIILGAGVVLVVVAGIAALFGGSENATAVRVAAVEPRSLESVVRASGWIQPRVSVDVQSDIMGRVTALYVKEGDVVERDQVLLRIDPTEYEAAVARAEASVSQALASEAQARASMLQAERDLARLTALRQTDSTLVSEQEHEDARTQAEVQEAMYEAARHGTAVARASLQEARDRLAKSVIRAPMDGVVTRLNIEEGETAIVGTMNNPGSLLLAVSDLSVMEAIVQVDETDVPEIEPGDSTVLTIDAFRRQEFTGRVTEISHSSTVDPDTRGMAQQSQAVDFEVVITLDEPPTTIRPDLSATAEVITARRPDALAIPIIALTVRERDDIEALDSEQDEAAAAARALTESDDVEGVFVVRDGTAHFTPVQVGITGREHFEVLAGLAEGDTVVAGPYEAVRQLNDGAAVRVLPTGEETVSPTSE